MKRIWMTAAAAVLALGMLAGCSGIDYPPSSSQPSSRPNGGTSSSSSATGGSTGNTGSSSSSGNAGSSGSASSKNDGASTSSSSTAASSKPEETSPWRYYKKDDGVIITGYNGELSGKVTIPSKIGEYPVVSIGINAFKGNDKIISVVIPEGVKSIQNCAFMECKQLTSVSLPSTVKSIGYGAFRECRKLKDIKLPAALEVIESHAFEWDVGLTEITIPGSVKEVDYSAFKCCLGLKKITLQEGIESVDAYAFTGAEITELELPSTLNHIGVLAFNCVSLEQLVFRESPSGKSQEVTIEHCAFDCCFHMKKIYFPKTLKKINDFLPIMPDYVYYGGTEEEWQKIEGMQRYLDSVVWYGKRPEEIKTPPINS